jgi:hypothetical protein
LLAPPNMLRTERETEPSRSHPYRKVIYEQALGGTRSEPRRVVGARCCSAATPPPNPGPSHGRRSRPLHHRRPARGWARAGRVLALGSVGVVYGDIVTSPLYALKESLAAAAAGGALTASPRQPERTSAALRQR